MTEKERIQKLSTLPWQALYNYALNMGIPENEINNKQKEEIINQLITKGIEDEEISNLVNDYIYGNRVTFTLWTFERPLDENALVTIYQLVNKDIPTNTNRFRNLKVKSADKIEDRIELVYVYSREYTYTNEEGKEDSIWELHRGCIWIGTAQTYLASISKHDKINGCIINYISQSTCNQLWQMKFPKIAIKRCTNPEATSRVVLQGSDGEKTAISRAGGLTDAQEKELNRIKKERMDTSGSYIAKTSENTKITIKYNTVKGSIGIYKHLSVTELFSWTKNAIAIIMEEVEKLRGKDAEMIFKEVGLPLNWTPFEKSYRNDLNWLLTKILAFSNNGSDVNSGIAVNNRLKNLLKDKSLFNKLPRVFCNECNAYEVPICYHCGSIVSYDEKGKLFCKCNAPLRITCSERHSVLSDVTFLYIPYPLLTNALNEKIHMVNRGDKSEYTFWVLNDTLFIFRSNEELNGNVEVYFDDIEEFKCKNEDILQNESIITLKEKCTGTSRVCSYKQINTCLTNSNLKCLPKLFYGVLPNFIPQPHSGLEYGDVSGQVHIGRNYYEMKGVIKSNTENKAKNNIAKMEETPLRSTSKEGQEMIRQFVEQGINDNRCDLIAIIAPQNFDNSFKGTFRHLAKLANKKVVFIGLRELEVIYSLHSKHLHENNNEDSTSIK